MLIQLSEICNKYGIKPNVVLHVGACQMEELDDYVQQGIKKVIWIEANPDLVQANVNRAKDCGHILLHGLIYDTDDLELDFHISNNLQSSSILEFQKHSSYHPQVEFTDTIKMKTSRLDSLLISNDIDGSEIDFLNLDIQGVELRALKSMGSYLDSIKYIYTEINTGEVYKENDQLDDLDEFLRIKGFNRVETKLTPYEWGDALYIKN
jgi:FkbM family methyltransferase